MATDEEYMDFLNKANADADEGRARLQQQQQQTASQANGEFKATDAGAAIPEPLAKVTRDAFYTSDADEPFVPVCLAWNEAGKGLPDEGV